MKRFKTYVYGTFNQFLLYEKGEKKYYIYSLLGLDGRKFSFLATTEIGLEAGKSYLIPLEVTTKNNFNSLYYYDKWEIKAVKSMENKK